MLSDEEKREYEELKSLLYIGTISQYGKRKLIDMFEKQSKEIEHQKEKRENQKQELAILNAKQIKFNKLVNTVNSYKGQFKRQQKEIEELKEKEKNLLIQLKDSEKELLEVCEKLRNSVGKDRIKAKIEEVKDGTYDAKIVLQSLLEKE